MADKEGWVQTGGAAYDMRYGQERCDTTELLVSQCACKNCKPPDTALLYNRIGPIFTASYDNRDGCECGSDILEGDEACYLDDELHCGECGRKAQQNETSKFTKRWNK